MEAYANNAKVAGMKTLNLYVLKNFILTLCVSVFIVIFGVMGARTLKIFEAISRGVPISDAMLALYYFMPMSLTITIPVGMLVATMLVFGRMSANNEITAMRACGISILQIISPLIVLAFLLSCFCLYLQLELGPKYAEKAAKLIKSIAISRPLTIIQPGTPIEYQGNSIYIGDIVNNTDIRDIQIFQFNKKDKHLQKDITAASGKVIVDEKKQLLAIQLFDASIVQYSKKKKRPERTFTERFELILDYGKKANDIKIGKKLDSLTYKEIFGRIVMYRKRGVSTLRLEMKLNQRLALGLAPIAFLLLGMPLAIRTSRRETSVGLLISVAMAGVYFISIMIFDAFYMYPQWHPELLVWIPNVLYQVGGLYFIWKISKR